MGVSMDCGKGSKKGVRNIFFLNNTLYNFGGETIPMYDQLYRKHHSMEDKIVRTCRKNEVRIS